MVAQANFVVSSRAPSVLVTLLHQLNYSCAHPIHIGRMQKEDAKWDGMWQNSKERIFSCKTTAKSFAARSLEERHAMTDRSDIILCNTGSKLCPQKTGSCH